MPKLLFFCAVFFASALNAQTFTVSASNDDGTGQPNTLSAAINSANSYSGAGNVVINITVSTVNLTGSALPSINQASGKRITINGLSPDSSLITRTSATNFRHFTITANDTVTMNQLILTNGNTTANGGAIELPSTAQLTMRNCRLSNNRCNNNGGAIRNDNGNLLTVQCLISGNVSGQSGAGIFNNSSGILIDSNSIIRGNRADNAGGGIFNNGTATLVGTTIASDTAATGGGGGIVNNPSASLTASGCTIQSNRATTQGGGIFHDGVTLALTNCNITANFTVSLGGGIRMSGGTIANCVISGNSAANGGGINAASATSITNCTVSGNSATSVGGGIRATATLNLRNTAVVFNTATTNPNIDGTVSVNRNSVVANPSSYPFHSPTNLRPLPNSASLVAQGISEGSVSPFTTPTPTADIAGITRSVTTPTIGAFETIALTPNALGSSSSAQTGTIPFSGTGVTLNALTNGGVITAQLYNAGTTGTPPSGIDRLSPYFWIISTSSTVFSGSATFDWSSVTNNGVTNPSQVRLLRRNGFGDAWQVVTIGGIGTNITASGLTGFSEFALGGIGLDNPLPVELSAFTGSATQNGVRLNWTTQSERNNAGFVIMRDGEELANYQFDQTLRGKGTTANATNYSFLDGSVERGKTYTYRLRSFDLDGTVHDYAQTVSVEVREAVAAKVFSYDLSQNYPNPFNPSTSIKYSVAQSGNVSLKVFDLLGREVLTLVNQVQPAGEYQISFNASSLAASGMYIYRLQSGSFTRTMKMLLVK